MTNILYDQGTFTYAVMYGVLALPMAHSAPNNGVVEFGNNSLSSHINYSDEMNATFDNYNNFNSDPYVRFLIKQEPQRLVDLANIGKPRTELGRKLLEHRKAALARGMKLLSEEEINSMVREVRGERT